MHIQTISNQPQNRKTNQIFRQWRTKAVTTAALDNPVTVQDLIPDGSKMAQHSKGKQKVAAQLSFAGLVCPCLGPTMLLFAKTVL